VGLADELAEPSLVSMTLRNGADGRYRYEGSFTCDRAGRYGFTVRVVPAHPDLSTFAELGRVSWAVHTTPAP
jgi:glycogen phosphorylase